ncbi:Rrf2 family transcriptional regulator [Caballeronia sp. AZ10_KS36]|uniref:Rrf2 family transcriptional regulator n=1 Tax=Caballeronia sp. AZ10_KS36 TaxID=2921757 RepID=UPI002029572E|nr:Rrf2 family transcriptional regulator [Caballeronia sp. AZ10_KS36]
MGALCAVAAIERLVLAKLDCANYSHIMSQTNVQFSVASHVMAALGAHDGEPVRSSELAGSVNAEPSFVRRVIAKLARAGLVTTTRGKSGACLLAKRPSQISMLDIYRASEAPAAFAIHAYPVTEGCNVSRNIKGCMESVLQQAQSAFEKELARQTLEDVVSMIRSNGRVQR